MRTNRLSKEAIERAKAHLLKIMMLHVGSNNKIGMGELYEQVFGRPYQHRINDTRILRNLITELRDDGVPIVSHSSCANGGYWVAASASEIAEYCEKGKRQAIGMLSRIAKMQKIALPDYIGQMQLELEGRDGQ